MCNETELTQYRGIDICTYLHLSLVSIVTGCWVDGRGLIPSWARDLSLLVPHTSL
jgi:hypothetical protein